MNIDQQIAEAQQIVHDKIDRQAAQDRELLGIEVGEARQKLHERFNSAARSLGQSRRWRNFHHNKE